MKLVARLLPVFTLLVGTFAQSTTPFSVQLQTVPPLDDTILIDYLGNGQFTLNGSILNGTLTYTRLGDETFDRIEDSSGLPLFSLTQDIGLEGEAANLATWFDIQLTDTQTSELLRGEWRINIGTAEYPNGALRGQITVVPEPNTCALAIIGGFVVALPIFRSRSRPGTNSQQGAFHFFVGLRFS